MDARIETLEAKKLIGLHMEMSLSKNRTPELWQTFMPRRDDVKNRVTSDYISMQIYEKGHWVRLSPDTLFTKWAAVEVSTHDDVPDQMAAYQLTGGLYAVFIHKGPAARFPETMQNILRHWLPASTYEIDDREHFEILPEGYHPMDPEAREEVWIPVKNTCA